MRTLIQDTSFLIDLFYSDPDAVAYLEMIKQRSRPEKSTHLLCSNCTKLSHNWMFQNHVNGKFSRC